MLTFYGSSQMVVSHITVLLLFIAKVSATKASAHMKTKHLSGTVSSVSTLFSAVWTNEVFTHCWLMLGWEMSSIKSHLALKVKAAALTGNKFTQLH